MYRGWDIVIDKENNRYKKLFRLLGIPINEGWEKLFEVHYIALTKVNMIKTNRSIRTIGNESSHKIERFAVYLYGSKNSIRVEACKKKSLTDAKKVAEEISTYLGVTIEDFVKD